MKKFTCFALGALAGAAAYYLVKKHYPNLTRAEIEARLEELLAKIRSSNVEGD